MHGLIQVTGYYNHQACGKALKLDLVNNPMLLTLPDAAARSAGWFFAVNNCNCVADTGNFKKVTKIVNGGYNGLNKRLAFYTQALTVYRNVAFKNLTMWV